MKYIKQIVIILIFMCTSMLVESQTLTGGVVYTVESAREAAFSGMEYEISMEPYKEYMKDPGFTAGKGGKKARISKRGRRVTVFPEGNYGVKYDENSETAFYYTSMGNLEYIEIDKGSSSFPSLSKKYDINGVLMRVVYSVRLRESFVYDVNKNLTAHWINKYCYDKYGKKINKRKLYFL